MKKKIWFGILAICMLIITGCTNNATHLDNNADLSTTTQVSSNGTDEVLTTTQVENIGVDNADVATTEKIDNVGTGNASSTNASKSDDVSTGNVSSNDTNKTGDTANNISTLKPDNTNTDKVDLNITEKMYVTYINEIYTNPDAYLGKRLKIEGMFSAQHIDITNMTYYYVYRQGPGCCGNDGSMCGFEFTTKDGEYPNENDWIEVVGTLDQYDEDGIQYLTIRADSVKVKDERGAEIVTQ